MYCRYCGNSIIGEATFCPYCGKEINYTQDKTQGDTLVSRARNGDQQAIAELYEQTYSKVFYTVKSMIKDEEAVFDIVQDTYIKAFSNLARFKGDDNDKLEHWVKQIAANTARDWLKKKKPVLFSEMITGEDTDTPIEELFADDHDGIIPEHVIDQEETVRLIREIIEELPEDQRAAIGMYYYEDMSVKEIAAAMGASENAVKARLLYGRRKIEKKVRELEKKGTKLYGLAPIPFLMLLFRNQKAYAAEAPNSAILQGILRSTAAKGAGATAHSTAAAAAKTAGGAHAAGTAAGTAAGGITAAKVALITVAAAAVVGGGAFGISRVTRNSEPPRPSPPALTAAISSPVMPASSQPTSEPAPVLDVQPEPEMPVPAVPSAEPVEPMLAEAEVPEPSSSLLEDAYAQYRIVLSQADSYDFGDYDAVTKEYMYALEYMHSGDLVPTLLLCQTDEDNIDQVRIFYYDVTSSSMIAPENILSMGVGQASYRGFLDMMGDGNGILVTDIAGMTGSTSLSRAVRDGNELTVREEWTGINGEDDPYSASARKIRWYDLSDRTGFDQTGSNNGNPEDAVPEEPADTPEPAEEEQDETAAWAETEEAAGRVILTGTIDTYSYEEAVELQGYPDWNGPDSRPYRIIVLDEPQRLWAKDVDGDREGEVRLILVREEVDIPNSLDGTHITFSIDPETLWWPSDTRIPVGEPGTKDIHVMGQ